MLSNPDFRKKKLRVKNQEVNQLELELLLSDEKIKEVYICSEKIIGRNDY